jgi:hypothetical protein
MWYPFPRWRHTTVGSDHVACVFCDVCPFRGYISRSPGGFRAVTRGYEWVVAAEARKQEDSSKLEEYTKQAVSLRSAEEHKKSACGDLICELKTLYVL